MKLTCGTDIIEINRIKEAIENLGDKFLKRIFTENEIEYCEKHKNQKYEHYAARFAAKEAIFKAISEKNTILNWNKLEIINLPSGKPQINFLENVENIESIDIFIANCKTYSVENVIALFKK